MKRFAFKMKLKPGMKEEYRKRHDEIWPEMKKLISLSGISDYSIFLDEDTNTLFAVQKRQGDSSSQDLGGEMIARKWWDHMADIMEASPDNSPITVPLIEVFHME